MEAEDRADDEPTRPDPSPPGPPRLGRRRLLTYGLGGAAVLVLGGVAGFELVSNGVLPGGHTLDELDGACAVPTPTLRIAPVGPSFSGTYFSSARRRRVGFTVAYPPGHGPGPGTALPLVVMLHGYGRDHRTALSGMTPAQAVALDVGGRQPAPMAMVTVDGGGGYWNPHPDDDPMAMVVDEVIPMCQAQGLGRPPSKVGLMGISMGGYGALLIAERYPHLVSAVAAISPAIWIDYHAAQGASPGAFASPESFREDDVVVHASALAGVPVRVASGRDDPFHPGVESLVAVLGEDALVDITQGCHSDGYFAWQEPPSLAFLAAHLASSTR